MQGIFYVVVDKVALLWCRRLGGPPRLAAGWLSAAGRKAGLAVGSAPWQFPAVRLAVWGRLAPVGIAVAVMVCGPWAFKAGTLDSMKKQGAGAGSLLLLSFLCSPGWC